MKTRVHFRNFTVLLASFFALSFSAIGQPQVTVIQPSESSIEWLVGTTHLISWTDNFIYPCRIDLVDYTIPASPVVTNIALSVEGSTYSWAIPGGTALKNCYKIRVSSAACPGCYSDESNSNFSLVASATGSFIHVEQPNTTGISWKKGSSHLISWSTDFPGTMKIKLYKGGVEHSVLAENVVGSTFLWTILNDGSILTGGNYSVRVQTQIVGDALQDDSDNNFAIAAAGSGHITMIQPCGSGIDWQRGHTYHISWNDDIEGHKDVKLYKGGVHHSNIALDVEGSTYDWEIPAGNDEGDDFKVRVCGHDDNSSYGESDHNFGIHESPAGGSILVVQPSEAGITWLRGSSYLISWEDNISNKVDIKLKKGAAAETTIASNVSGSTYVWPIPIGTATGSDYIVKIYSHDDAGLVDASDHNFSIQDNPAGASITVLQPSVSGIHWLRGYSYLISWIDDVPGTVDIKLYKGGILASTIQSSVVGSTFVWDIPIGTAEGADYEVKVFSHADAAIVGISANPFSITASPVDGVITVLQPNGGEYWYIGNSYLISWQDNFPENVDIDLVHSDGSLHAVIQHNVEGSTYVWNTTVFPLVDAGDYKVKIYSSLTSTISDMSDAVFHILCLPLAPVVYPNPANDIVNIKIDNPTEEQYNVSFTNRFNLEVLNHSFSNSQEIRISTADLQNGIYFVTVSSKSAVSTSKVIIQH